MKDSFSARRFSHKKGVIAGSLMQASSGEVAGYRRQDLFRERRAGKYAIGGTLLPVQNKIDSLSAYSPYVKGVAKNIVALLMVSKTRPATTIALQQWVHKQRIKLPEGIVLPPSVKRVGKVGMVTIDQAITLLTHEGILLAKSSQKVVPVSKGPLVQRVASAAGRRILSVPRVSMVARKKSLAKNIPSIVHAFATPGEKKVAQAIAEEIQKAQDAKKESQSIEDIASAVNRTLRNVPLDFGARKRVINPTMIQNMYATMREKGLIIES